MVGWRKRYKSQIFFAICVGPPYWEPSLTIKVIDENIEPLPTIKVIDENIEPSPINKVIDENIEPSLTIKVIGLQ